MLVSGHTRIYGLIGDPVSGSLSPFIMNRALQNHAIDAVYVPFPVAARNVIAAVAGLHAIGVSGINVTYPHKASVLGCVDGLAPEIAAIQAVNTVRFTNGRSEGFNTDASGTALALEHFAKLTLAGRTIVIFGAGGSARAAACGLLRSGAAGVTFCARRPEMAAAAVAPLNRAFPDRTITILPFRRRTNAWRGNAPRGHHPQGEDPAGPDPQGEDASRNEPGITSPPAGGGIPRASRAGEVPPGEAVLERAVRGADVVINATPIGMSTSATPQANPLAGAADPGLVLDPGWIHPGQCCFDFVYGHRETPFLRDGRAQGATCLSGLQLLVAQAVGSFEIWTGHRFDPDEMLRAVMAQVRGTSGGGEA